jgi:ribosomal protein S18 acetylase RimI-like enzyme
MNVRRLGPGDTATVLSANHLFDEPADAGAVGAYLDDNRNVFLIAFDGERPVGFLRGTELGQLKSQRKQMFLYEIAVSDDRRRQGVGAALIRRLLDRCRESGFEEVFVFTDPANEAAVRLYRSTGAVTETPADRMFVYQLARDAPGPDVPPPS